MNPFTGLPKFPLQLAQEAPNNDAVQVYEQMLETMTLLDEAQAKRATITNVALELLARNHASAFEATTDLITIDTMILQLSSKFSELLMQYKQLKPEFFED